MRGYTSEQFWKLYAKLPQELKDSLFAEETGEAILDVCTKNEIDDNLRQVVELVGEVLVGLLPIEDFQEVLEKELGVDENTARKVNHEITRFVFYPVKESLASLYNVKPSSDTNIEPTTEPRPKPELLDDENVDSAKEKIKRDFYEEESNSSDTYREPIE